MQKPSAYFLPYNFPRHLRAVALLLCLCCSLGLLAQGVSEIVFYDEAGMLRYRADGENNYVPDFSHAGYHNGEVPLPEVPTVLTIQPVADDNTAHIQAALDELAARTPDANGYRGALLLEAGVYDVSGQLFIRESGMVLRGVGQAETSADNTIIRGLGNTPERRNLIVMGPISSAPNWAAAVTGTESIVTAPFTPNGSRTLEVAAAELYREGDNVVVFHPSTEDWLRSIDFGATASDDPWRVGDLDMFYNRYVTEVNIPESKIILDAPIYDHLDRSLAQARVYRINTQNLKRESGIENLRIDVVTEGELVENHVRTTVFLNGLEDCWIKDVTALNFSYALVDMRNTTRVTVTGCAALEPHSPILGARRYNFNVSSRSNNILFANNTASEGRHTFVSNGASSAAGIVFTASSSDRDLNPSEGHRRWSQGLLFDDLTFTNSNTVNLLNLYNRGDFGTGHGWSSVHSVAWNVTTPSNRGMIIQKP
ncbi:MAG: peptidoglycan-binding protein, partial [Bacteroidota bacterium]